MLAPRPTATTPTSSEARLPKMIRDRMSRPRLSVPRKKAAARRKQFRAGVLLERIERADQLRPQRAHHQQAEHDRPEQAHRIAQRALDRLRERGTWPAEVARADQRHARPRKGGWWC